MAPVRDTSNHLNTASSRIEIMLVIVWIRFLWSPSFKGVVLAQEALFIPFSVCLPCLQVRVMGNRLVRGCFDIVWKG